MTVEPQVVLDNMRDGHAQVFAHPSHIFSACAVGEVPQALAAMQQALAAGHRLAGYFSYELGYALEPCLQGLLPMARHVPLLWFGQFDAPPRSLTGDELAALWPQTRVYASRPAFEWDQAQYRERFDAVVAAIAAGDVYEVNLSLRARFRVLGDPRALYGRLRRDAQVAHGAFVDDGQHQILSFSPESFFAVDSQRRITAQPMKGTAARNPDPTVDRALCEALRHSAKERAENLMIVDLIRNDLGRIAVTGSVTVPELFALESYPTVHQMTSTVRATLRRDCDIAAIVQALFPCGSVTGAPKLRAMQLIRGLESSPRGVYCGAIGTFSPDGEADFNVAIRTLTLAGGEGELGIGGAVVADSDPQREYEECVVKSRFFTAIRRPVALLETLRYAAGHWPRRALHLQRLAASAAALGISYDEQIAVAALESAVRAFGTSELRVRLQLAEDGALSIQLAPLPAVAEPLKWLVWPGRIRSDDALNRFKTDWRNVNNEALAWAHARGAGEVVLVNERGEVSEGSFTNVFVQQADRLTTPPLSSGALPGCLRAELLATGQCVERVLTLDELLHAEHVYLGNSLRGLLRAQRVDALPPARGGRAPALAALQAK
ncbi:MAG TPA: aminodeoxychorismate synthase component I [Nevskiaceae bacterium]|nr:aminodeoxychorismate synthase component I [Nevskiaceae bacterium]